MTPPSLLRMHPYLEPSAAVGWDGFLYPWTFSVHDFEPITGRIHQPPPSHQTFQGRNFVICSLCPRKLDDPLAAMALWIAGRELTRPGDDRRCRAAFA